MIRGLMNRSDASNEVTSPLLQPGAFVWGVGIEDTIIGTPLRDGGLLDEYQLTQHDCFWKSDLDRAAALGIRAIRYGVPWHRVHPAPGVFDWSSIDERLRYAAVDKGLLVIVDLVHYGTPTWLPDAFIDPRFPTALADYAGAFATRYRDIINHYTPLNEPLITASFCGQRGIWPPYLHGDRGWLRVVAGAAAGIRSAIQRIREVDGAAVIVHVEAAKLLFASGPASAGDLEVDQERAFLATDLVLGCVDANHPLMPWLLDQGLSGDDLDLFRIDPPTIDLIGVNYYPDLSVREVIHVDERRVEVTMEGGAGGLEEILTRFWHRYGLPLLVSETSNEGSDSRKTAWLNDVAATSIRLRASGVPVQGAIWWPLFDFVDWAYASAGRTVEEFWTRALDADGEVRLAPVVPPGQPGDPVEVFLRRMGLWRLESSPDGTLRRIETPAAAHLAHLARMPVDLGDDTTDR